eukprot:403372831
MCDFLLEIQSLRAAIQNDIEEVLTNKLIFNFKEYSQLTPGGEIFTTPDGNNEDSDWVDLSFIDLQELSDQEINQHVVMEIADGILMDLLNLNHQTYMNQIKEYAQDVEKKITKSIDTEFKGITQDLKLLPRDFQEAEALVYSSKEILKMKIDHEFTEGMVKVHGVPELKIQPDIEKLLFNKTYDYKRCEVKALKHQQISNLQDIKQETLEKLIIFVYVMGTKSVDASGEFQFRQLKPVYRDIIKNFLKSIYKHSISDDTKKFKPHLLLSMIEEHISERQIEKLNQLGNHDLVYELNPLHQLENKDIDITKFLLEVNANPNIYHANLLNAIDYLYQGDEVVVNQKVKVVQNAFRELDKLINQEQEFNLPLCIIKNVEPNKGYSKHVKLAFSGFLSQLDDFGDQWKDLIKYLGEHSTRAFCVQWQSITSKELVIAIMKALGKASFDLLIEILNPVKGAFLVKLLTNMNRIKSFIPVAQEINALFNKAKKNAKLTGKMLAISLALGFPFKTQTISLIGFSLGTQVIKSCLRMLDKLGATDIVQNVTLMGGASNYKKSKQDQWVRIFDDQVAGHIKNLHTTKDVVLLFYQVSQMRLPIGRIRIFENIEQNVSNKLMDSNSENEEKQYYPAIADGHIIRFKNYDISKLISNIKVVTTLGHMYYREKMLDLLMHSNVYH